MSIPSSRVDLGAAAFAASKPSGVVTCTSDAVRSPTATQGEMSKNAPVLSLPSLNALFAHKVKTMGDSVFLCVPKKDSSFPASSFEYDQYTFSQTDSLVKKICAKYARILPPRRHEDAQKVVALFADSGFDYALNALAICRLGHTVAYLSTNNSVPALAHLVKATKAQCLLYGTDQTSKILDLKAFLLEQGQTSTQMMQWTTVAEAVETSPAEDQTGREAFPASQLSYAEESPEVAFIVHSSGSTGFPKPILITHRASVANLASAFGRDGFITVPLFHNFGHASFWRAVYAGKKLFMHDGRLTADVLVDAIGASTASQFYAVPFVLKLLSESERGLEALRRFELVTFAGSACPSEIGDMLVQQHNVPLVALYGSTEVGQLMTSFRDFATDKEWEFLRPTAAFKPFLHLENVGSDESGPFEVVVDSKWRALTKSNRPDGSYATSDLFVRHPTLPDAFKFVGRSDDTLVHYNGEKTNPVPMELAIRSSPYVAECLVFGAGRAQTGVLVVPSSLAVEKAQAESSAASEASLDRQLGRLVWKAVEAANREAPSHSRVVPELVKLLPADTKFSSADKGSLIRAKVVKAFEQEIAQAYADYEAGTAAGLESVQIQQVDDEPSAISVVAQVVSEVSGRPISPPPASAEFFNVDLIQLGIDSLQANRIRNLLQQRVQLPSRLPPNLVFEHPTVRKLAKFLLSSARGEEQSASSVDRNASENQAMHTTMQQLERLLMVRDATIVQAAAAACAVPRKHTIVLTGSTGSLGAHILQQLATMDDIKTVVCLNRAKSNDDAQKRTEESLQVRGLSSTAQIVAEKGVRIVCLASDLNKPQLGLDNDAWGYLLKDTSCVIHNGWPVNFNMSVESFSSSLFGTVALMNLLSQTVGTQSPRFIFSSSVSASARRLGNVVEETISQDAKDAQEMGYARSKWMVERLCGVAQQLVGGGFDAVVARIGQMVGDRRSGIWNQTEAVPLMLKSAQTVGCLPNLPEQVSWLPVNDAGFIMARLVQPAKLHGVVHIVNPSLTPFAKVLELLRAPHNLGDSFEVVDTLEWLRRLAESDKDPEKNPTIKLLSFFHSKYDPSLQAQTLTEEYARRKQAKKHQVSHLQSVFQQLGLEQQLRDRLVEVDDQLLTNIVAAWRRDGFLL